MDDDDVSVVDYVALPSSAEGAAPEKNRRGTALTAVILVALASFPLLLFARRPASTMMLAHDDHSKWDAAPPLLCYEFSATLVKRTALTGSREHTSSATTLGLRVSRSLDLVGELDPPRPPFEKAFRSFWTRAASNGSCVQLYVEPFFDEAVCVAYGARTPNASDADADEEGCSTHKLRSLLPLDASFGRAATAAYVQATRVHSGGGAARGGGSTSSHA